MLMSLLFLLLLHYNRVYYKILDHDWSRGCPITCIHFELFVIGYRLNVSYSFKCHKVFRSKKIVVDMD